MPVIENCALRRINPNPLNVRRDVGDVTELADSIRAQGLLEPLVVAPTGPEPAAGWAVDTKQAFTLIAGHRRLAAAKAAGLKGVTVIIRPELDTEAAQLEAMLVENLQRVDITPVEEAAAYRQLLAFDLKAPDIARLTGRAVATVKARLTLGALPDATQDRVHSGQISLGDAMVMAEFATDPTAVKQLEQAVGGYDFRHVAQRLRNKREAVKEEKKTRAALAKAEVPVIDKPEGYPWRSAVAPLHRCLDRTFFEDRDAAIAGHASCPGHAAVIDDHGRAEYVCLDPATHHPADDGDDPRPAVSSIEHEFATAARARGWNPSELTEEQQTTVDADVLEKRRVAEVLAAATDVRAQHVDELLAPGRKAPLEALALWVGLKLVENVQTDEIEALGLPPLPEELTDADYELVDPWIIGQVLALKPDDLARLALRDLRGICERPLAAAYRRSWDHYSDRAWLRLLEQTGYPITPEEKDMLAPELTIDGADEAAE